MGKRDEQVLRSFDDFADPSFRRLRAVMRRVPSNPRCKLCEGPFGGVGGKLLSLTGFAQSRKNPNMCRKCFEDAPAGGVEGEVGVLFADVRGWTALAETIPPGQAVLLLNRFYAIATKELIDRDAIIDKLVGDEVMALFIPPLVGERHRELMVDAAEALLRGLGFGGDEEPWLDVGIGLAFGPAFVGNVGAGEVKDFTAVGDVVNIAARLQAQAEPGTIVMACDVWDAVADRFPDAPELAFELKGKSAPFAARVVDLRVASERAA